MRMISALLFLILLMTSMAYAKLYVWVDKDGVKHMSNIPPKENVILKKEKAEGFAPPLKIKEDLVLSNWFPMKSKSGVTIKGEVKNNSSFRFKKVVVRATIRDDKGKIVIQREVKTNPENIPPDGIGNFEIDNVKTQMSFLSKTNMRFDIFNGGKVEVSVPGKKPLQQLEDMEATD